MADFCTYADLRFVKSPLPLNKCETPGPDPEASCIVYMNAAENTYENVTKSEGGAQDRASGKYTARELAKLHGTTSCSKYISYILGASLLITLVTCIGLGVRLFQVLQDHEAMESNFLKEIHTQNQALQHTEMRSMEAEQKLDKAKDELEKIQDKMNDLNLSCHLNQKTIEENTQQLSVCQGKGAETQSRLSEVESTLNGIRNLFMDHDNAEYCRRGWNSVEESCIFISKEEQTREASEQRCKSMGGWLIGSRVKDRAVKEFMSNVQRNGYWVGLRTRGSYDDTWVDTRYSNADLNSYGTCGVTQWEYIRHHNCQSLTKYRFICEKPPMKITLKNGIPAVQL